jgi:hypothetical protein
LGCGRSFRHDLGGGGDGGGRGYNSPRFTWMGSHRAAFLGGPATGRNVVVKGVVIDHLIGDKMSKSRILMDSVGMMQLGVIPTS